MPSNILIEIKQKDFTVRWINREIKTIGRLLRWDRSVGLDIAVVSKTKIKLFNKKYRDKNKTTDVLSFPTMNPRFISGEPGKFLGDILINYDAVLKQAEEYGWSARREFRRLLVHAVLHLLGYDHERSKRAAGIMEKKEKSLLRQWR